MKKINLVDKDEEYYFQTPSGGTVKGSGMTILWFDVAIFLGVILCLAVLLAPLFTIGG